MNMTNELTAEFKTLITTANTFKQQPDPRESFVQSCLTYQEFGAVDHTEMSARRMLLSATDVASKTSRMRLMNR